jgi:RNA polymerase sigma-70 factor (ECF subfamily)
LDKAAGGASSTMRSKTSELWEERVLHEYSSISEQDRSDTELYRRFLSGNASDQLRFVRRWETPMFQIAFRIVGQSADAEEVRQAVLLRIIQKPDVLPKPEHIAGWIRRCVVNESITLVRKRNRHSYETIDEYVDQPDSHDTDDAYCLRQLLEGLEPKTRALLTLRFDEGLSVRQIAEIVEKPRSTVHAKIQSAINHLRKQLKSSQ